jgi:hypothetical protein
MPCYDRSSHMEHVQKIRAAAVLLLDRHGQRAPARYWARELVKRRDPETAEVCMQIADAANNLLTHSPANEPAPTDVLILSAAVTGQMIRADRLERRGVEKLMTNVKRRQRAKCRGRSDQAA